MSHVTCHMSRQTDCRTEAFCGPSRKGRRKYRCRADLGKWGRNRRMRHASAVDSISHVLPAAIALRKLRVACCALSGYAAGTRHASAPSTRRGARLCDDGPDESDGARGKYDAALGALLDCCRMPGWWHWYGDCTVVVTDRAQSAPACVCRCARVRTFE